MSRSGKRKKRGKYKLPRTIATMMLIAAVAMIFGVPGSASATQDDTSKVTICHRTNSTHNPYVQETVSFDGTTGKLHDTGQGDHTSHTGPVWDSSMPNGGDWGDIIPPYTWGDGGRYAGLNWTDAGQAIYNNGCNPATPPPPPPPPPTKENVSGSVTFAEGSVECMRDVVLYEPPTYDVGGNVHVLYDTARGHHQANFGQTVTVKATGVDDPSKYELTGQTTWTHTFAAQPAPPSDCGTTKPPKHHQKPPKHHTVPPKAHCSSSQTLINGACVTTTVAHTGKSDSSSLSIQQIALAALMALLLGSLGSFGFRRVLARIRR